MSQPTRPLDYPIDFYQLFSDISEGDLSAWQRAHTFGAKTVERVNAAWENAEYDTDLVHLLAEYDLISDGVHVPGHQHFTPLGAGLVTMELARWDASVSTMIAVQAGLVMQTIDRLGSPEQKDYWLPKLASAEAFGAFALTEPDHGSDSIALETSAVKDGDEFVINGAKRWIGNGAVGHITIVWARKEDGDVGAFLVPQDSPGYQAETITGKASLRGIPQAHITLDNVRIPAENQLPGAKNFRDTAGVLALTRSSVSWSALGIALGSFEKALAYSKERKQFGKPLASFQIIQQRLADMLQEVTGMALYCKQLAQLESSGELTAQQAALAKVHNTRGARAVAANARDMLGGDGILLDNRVMRHMADIEALHTYEGTDTMQSLIVGKALTGVSAYK